MKKAAIRLHCSCGWQELIAVDGSLSNEEAFEENNKILEDHMKTHDPNFSIKDFKPVYVGTTKQIIN